MVNYCCIPNCGNTSKDRKMHVFPQDIERYNDWIAAERSKLQENVRRSYKVCDNHFSSDQRIPQAKQKRMKSNLKADSILCLTVIRRNDDIQKRASVDDCTVVISSEDDNLVIFHRTWSPLREVVFFKLEPVEWVNNFISLVETRAVIYDKTHPLHSNTVYIEEKWREISRILNRNVKLLKAKWKSLRDGFRENHKKFLENAPRSGGLGGNAINYPTWKYYKSLTFLITHIACREISSSIKKDKRPITNTPPLDEFISMPSTSTCNNNNAYDQSNWPSLIIEQEEVENNPEQVIGVDEVYTTFEQDEERNDAILNRTMEISPNTRKTTKNSSSTLNKLMEMENKKMKLLKDHLEDSDLMFLSSLAPQLKELPPKKKAMAKIELQQVLLKYMSDD